MRRGCDSEWYFALVRGFFSSCGKLIHLLSRHRFQLDSFRPSTVPLPWRTHMTTAVVHREDFGVISGEPAAIAHDDADDHLAICATLAGWFSQHATGCMATLYG